MIYVTHDQVEAMTMADRIVVLNDGRVEQVGSPMELYHHPASLFVAGFIGAPKMNFLDVEVKAVAEHAVTLSLWNSSSIAVPAPAAGARAGERLKLGIRPEHVGIAGDGEFEGEVEALEHLGPRTYLHARLADGSRFVVETAGDTCVREGDRLALRIRADAESPL